MSTAPVSIAVPGSAELHLSTSSGRVVITAEQRDDVLIEEGAPSDDRIERDATGRVRLASAKGGSAPLEVRCPIGSDIAVGTISGTVTLRGQLGAVRVTTVSSNVTIDSAEELDVRSISGSIEVDRCSGRCRLQTKSGSASCGGAGSETTASTLSGRIKLGETRGKVHAQSVSGTIEVGMAAKGDVKVHTISGSVRVRVPEDVRPSARLRSISGRPRNDCPPGQDCEIRVQSMSGKIEVVPG
jgi:DUF4097 and DUF4098 domain-containing protein YvlB